MPRLIWVLAGLTVILLVLSWGGSLLFFKMLELSTFDVWIIFLQRKLFPKLFHRENSSMAWFLEELGLFAEAILSQHLPFLVLFVAFFISADTDIYAVYYPTLFNKLFRSIFKTRKKITQIHLITPQKDPDGFSKTLLGKAVTWRRSLYNRPCIWDLPCIINSSPCLLWQFNGNYQNKEKPLKR